LTVKLFGAHKRHLEIIKGGGLFFKGGDSFLIQKTNNHSETHISGRA